MREFLKSIAKDEKGLETVEYAIMTGLIVSAVVLAIGTLALAIKDKFGVVTAHITTGT